MQTHICSHDNCQRYGTSEEMIVVSGGGYRDRYCSWFHAAAGCLHRMCPHNFKTYWSELARRAKQLLDEGHKHFNPDNPTENIMPTEKAG